MNEWARRTRIPGEFGLWLFIFSELAVFGAYFVLFSSEASLAPTAFGAGRASLTPAIDLINTILLLTGSLFVVLAGRDVTARSEQAARLLDLAALTGLAFLLLKAVQYKLLIDAGHDWLETRFFTWYFLLTAFHAFHVFIGIVALRFLASALRQRRLAVSMRWVESVGCYWHMVDLVWVAIFAIVI